MSIEPRRMWRLVGFGGAFLGVVVTAVVVWFVTSGDKHPAPTPTAGGDTTPAGSAGPLPPLPPHTPVPSGVPHQAATVSCPRPTTTVKTAGQLTAALARARPGDSIRLADGVYAGKFETTASGTPGQPIFLCGGPGAVLDGGGITKGYVMYLNGASDWRLVGFSVRNGQKGVVTDGSQRSVIQGLTVENIGDEAIHLRRFSSENLVIANTVRRTGLHKPKFGEGVYIGSAKSNWCTYTDCKPDRSDRNVIRSNKISDTTAEAVDIKEGTTGGEIIGNTFDGSALSGADAWVNVKGNGYLVQGNTGVKSPKDGFQTHQVVAGWGTGNVFRGNVANVEGPGFGFHLTPAAGNSVACDNKVGRAGKGLTNVKCS